LSSERRPERLIVLCMHSRIVARDRRVDWVPMASGESSEGVGESLYEEIAAECGAMVRFALGHGQRVPPPVVEIVVAALGEGGEQPSILALTSAHHRLARIVAPAEPHSLRLLQQRLGEDLGQAWLKMPLPRNLTMVAVFSMVILLGVGMSPDVSNDPAAGNPLLSSGPVLLVNQLFFISIASLGACFHALFMVKRYIVAGNYDPSYDATYWVRYLLGVISGLILASLIDVDPNSALYAVARPVLALVGGFSASVVYRALQRMIDTVDNLLSGDQSKLFDEKARLQQSENEARDRNARVDTAAALLRLQSQLQGGMKPDEAHAAVGAVIAKLLPDGELGEPDHSSGAKPAGLEPSAAQDAAPREDADDAGEVSADEGGKKAGEERPGPRADGEDPSQ
jgi:hypothetical protein